jgi:hypothetical protein
MAGVYTFATINVQPEVTLMDRTYVSPEQAHSYRRALDETAGHVFAADQVSPEAQLAAFQRLAGVKGETYGVVWSHETFPTTAGAN